MLFVDDEPSIRLTLPEILRMHGHTVRVAATVPEALAAIQSERFDVLISDLNIGHPGDGFTVVSAMRRIQPECVTLILTGYPGFESALQAIRSQVDDYLVKPTQVERLVETIERKLTERTPHKPLPIKRVREVLQDCQRDVVERAVSSLTPGSKARRTVYLESLPKLLHALIVGLEDGHERESFVQGAAYGVLRRAQGGSIDDLFEEFRALERAVYDVVQENLLGADVSNLVPDLRIFNDHVQDVLRHAVNAYLAQPIAA
ncbi:MAG TPA: response regulator [Terriglobales bacterium]|nr:response regulator [Terriglobales bacterium]